MRPMVLENQDDTIAQKIDDQFYLGQSILVAPILQDQARSRQVYLPMGKWYLFNKKDQEYDGNKLYNFDCPLDQTLIFVKSGSVIITIKEKNYNFTELDKVTLLVDSYGQEGQATIKFKLNNKLHELNYNLKLKQFNFNTKLKYEII